MMSIGALARRSGVKVPTIRYYEGVGLLPEPERSEGGRRRYDRAALERLAFIRHGRELGLSLEDIRRLLEINARPAAPCAEADAIARRHLAAVEDRIARLQALKTALERMLDRCSGVEARDCAVLETLADHDHRGRAH